MDCTQARESFSEARDKRLEGAAARAFEEHISSCHACGEEFRRYNVMLDAAGETEPLKAGSDFETALVERLSREMFKPPGRRIRLGWAAVFALLVVGAALAGVLAGRSTVYSEVAALRMEVRGLHEKLSDVFPRGDLAYTLLSPGQTGDVQEFVDAASLALDDINLAASEKELTPREKETIRTEFVDWNFPEWAGAVHDGLCSLPEAKRVKVAAELEKAARTLGRIHVIFVSHGDWDPSEMWRDIDNSGIIKTLEKLKPVGLHRGRSRFHRKRTYKFPNQSMFKFEMFKPGGNESNEINLDLYLDGKRRIVLGDIPGAKLHFEKMLMKDPDSKLAKRGFEWTVRILARDLKHTDSGDPFLDRLKKRVDDWFKTMPDDVSDRLQEHMGKVIERVQEKPFFE